MLPGIFMVISVHQTWHAGCIATTVNNSNSQRTSYVDPTFTIIAISAVFVNPQLQQAAELHQPQQLHA